MQKFLFDFIQKKYVQFITCVFLLKSMCLLRFWKIFQLKIYKLLPAFSSRNFRLRSIYLDLLIIRVVFLHYTWREERSVWFPFYPYFFSFLLLCFLFLSVFFLTDTNDSQNYRKRRGSPYFPCFLLPPTPEHSCSSSRFIPLLFNRSICDYQTDSWWDLFSLEICILFTFLLMQLSRSY